MTKPPFVSIVIPTLNRPRELSACLHSLSRLVYPRDRFEAIVVDDGSQTSMEGVVAPYRSLLDLTLLLQHNAGPGAARNTGAKRAKGQYLAFTDDDCLPARNWLETLAARFAADKVQAIGGRILNALHNNLYSMASQTLADIVYAYFNSDSNHARFLSSNNFALPKDRFLAVGGFDINLTTSEDRELCDRWLQRGYTMIYAPEAVVYHYHLLTFRTFCLQHFNYGRGTFRFHEQRIHRHAGPFKLEPKFYLHMLSSPFSQPQSHTALLLAALLMTSQGAKAAGFFWEMANRVAGKVNAI